MFRETEQGETQYCPMCLEWSEKYKRLQAENEENLHYLACMTEQRNKLKLALEEIRSYVNTQLDGFGNDVYGITKNQITTITNKINEVLK